MGQKSAASSLGKPVLLVVCLPLVFALVGGWQLYRSDAPELPKLLEAAAHCREAVEELQTIVAEKSEDALVQMKDGRKETARYALWQAIIEQRGLNAQILPYTIKKMLAAIAIVLGILGALTGGGGLLNIRSLGKKAILSLDAMLAGFQAGLKKIPFLIGAVGFMAAVALACVVSYEVFSYINSGAEIKRDNAKLVALCIFAVACLLSFAVKLVWKMFKASRAVFERDPLCLMGKSIRESDAPKVWAFVRQIAEKIGAKMPDGIIVGLNE